MTICHTADLHIRNDVPERLEALRTVLATAREAGGDLLVISGDLFDRESDARRSVTAVRELFQESPLPVVVIPGNHDAHAFQEGAFFGERVTVLGWEPLELEACTLVGVPFEGNLGMERLAPRLRQAAASMRGDKPRICLFHGELLDSFFSRSELGEEGDGRYMPARLSYFADAGFDYVLAGHMHASFSVWQSANRCYFCYPGSPVAITNREIGPRVLDRLELGGAPQRYALDTPFVSKVNLRLDPFDERDPVEGLAELCRQAPAGARLLVTIDGYVDPGRTEQDLVSAFKQVLSEYELAAPPRYLFQDVRSVLGEPLFQAFEKRLEERKLSAEETERVRREALRAFMEISQ